MAVLEDPLKLFNPRELEIGQQQQKHFLEANGMMYGIKYKDEKCFCQHPKSIHLEYV